MKLRLRRISPASLAATLGLFYFVLGIFVGIFGIFAALSGTQFTMSGPISFSGRGTDMLPLALAYPFLAALVGTLSGFVVAWVYNFIARFTKGVLFEYDEAGRHEN